MRNGKTLENLTDDSRISLHSRKGGVSVNRQFPRHVAYPFRENCPAEVLGFLVAGKTIGPAQTAIWTRPNHQAVGGL